MLKKGGIKLLIDVFMYPIVLLIGIKLKKCVAELFLKILFCEYIGKIDIKLKE